MTKEVFRFPLRLLKEMGPVEATEPQPIHNHSLVGHSSPWAEGRMISWKSCLMNWTGLEYTAVHRDGLNPLH